MSVVCPLTKKSLNMLTALKRAVRFGDMNKPSNVIVQNQECHTMKDHIVWLIKRSELTEKGRGEYVEITTKSSSSIRKIMLYPSGKEKHYLPYVSLDIQFKDLPENTYIEGDVYILGENGEKQVSKTFSGHASNLKKIDFDAFMYKNELKCYFVNNTLTIQLRIISILETNNSVSDKSNYQVHNSPEIINFKRVMHNMENIKRYSDVSLQMDSKIINCHKCILASESPALFILFRSCKRNILDMHDKSTTLFEELVHFFYSGNIRSLNFNHICQLYISADEFEVLNLKDICSSILSSSLSKINVPYIFELSMAYKDHYLIEACINFVKKNDIKSLKETFVERSLKIKN